MRKVLDLGVNPSRIIFANPTKQTSHIRAAADNNVARMTFDNEGELYKIKALHPQAQ
jgi:ornithine decarboxylase